MPFYSRGDKEELKLLLMGVSCGSSGGGGGGGGGDASAGADFLIASARVQVACLSCFGSIECGWWGRGLRCFTHALTHARSSIHTCTH